MPTCSIIVPVYNHAALTRLCLETLLRTALSTLDAEIIVVDDASSDATPTVLAAYASRVKIIRHATNAGFARSCNEGAALASGDHLVFLNNDTVPQDGWLNALVDYAGAHPRAAMVGSKLLYLDQTVQHAGVVICQDRLPRHIYAGFPAEHPAVNRSRRFQAVTGACALVRRAIFQAVGGFDTGFVNGYEDVDLCLRLGQAGHEVHYCHTSVVYHLESVTRSYFPPSLAGNDALYRQRWFALLRPDDFDYYLADGLLGMDYWEHVPARLRLDPLLATVTDPQRQSRLDELLAQRAAQVFDLLQESARLTTRALRAEMALGQPPLAPSLYLPTAIPSAPPTISAPRRLALLILDDALTQPGKGAGLPRTLALIRCLVALGHAVTFVPLIDSDPYQPVTTELQDLGVRVVHSRRDTAPLFLQLSGTFDVAIVSRPHNAWALPLLRSTSPSAALVYDAEALVAARDEALAAALPATERARLTGEQELAIAARADALLAVSEIDRQALSQAWPDRPLLRWGHACTSAPTPASFRARRGLLFIGNLGSAPNFLAAMHLVDQIAPRVQRTAPLPLALVGGDAPEMLRAHASADRQVAMPGHVADLTPFYDRARVFIAPHTIAAGIPLKVVEAMASGLPCVVSPLLASQLGVRDEREVLVGDGPEELADRIVTLHQDSTLWQRLRDNALAFVTAEFDPERQATRLDELLHRAVAHRQATLLSHRLSTATWHHR